MYTIAVNGSPRKKWNTAMLLESALKGAAEAGSKTEMINLYDFNYKGCISCFECKRHGGRSFGKCAVKDGLAPVLEKIGKADALIIGSPIYIGSITGETRSFLERLIFQYMLYTVPYQSSFKGKLKVGLIYSMGANKERFDSSFKASADMTESSLKRSFGNLSTLFSYDTYQMDDYSDIDYGMDIGKKLERRKTVFPEDCKRAYEMGNKLSL
ncbi:MAG: flavodoxin family protein [Brevinematales bacterium]|jgi:multimeric flavodoxin WrbA